MELSHSKRTNCTKDAININLENVTKSTRIFTLHECSAFSTDNDYTAVIFRLKLASIHFTALQIVLFETSKLENSHLLFKDTASKNVFKIIFKWQNLELCTDFENGCRLKFQRKSIFSDNLICRRKVKTTAVLKYHDLLAFSIMIQYYTYFS